MASTLTVRQRILNYIKDVLAGMREDDDYGIQFAKVAFGKMPAAIARKRATCGIVVGQERKNQNETGSFELQDPTLEVWIEWGVTIQASEDATEIMEFWLGAIQRRFLDDEAGGECLGGLAISFDEMTNEISSTSFEDNTQQGVILYRVHYRYDRRDPRVGMTD